jgi:RNase H
MALDMALKNNKHNPPDKKPNKITIFSDSQAALKAIAQPGNRSGQSLIWLIRLRIKVAESLGIQTKLQWVPAHVGIQGNERADYLAKQATGWKENGPREQPAKLWERNVQLNSAANRREKLLGEQEWQKMWQEGKTGRELFKLMPKITKKSIEIYKGKPKAICAALAQARTGKIALKAYLASINRADSNKCECGQVQTLKHILLVCPKFSNLRRQVWINRIANHTCVKPMLTEPEQTTKAMKFLIKTGLLEQFKEIKDQI